LSRHFTEREFPYLPLAKRSITVGTSKRFEAMVRYEKMPTADEPQPA
jgi:hypothetical protein